MTELEKQAVELYSFPEATKAYIKGYQDANQWIDCNERLPENLVNVLVIRSRDNTYSVGRYEAAYKSWYTDYSTPHYDTVSHWMPLPNKPLK